MPWYFGGMAPTAARRAKPVQRSSSQGLQGNPDACHPGRGVVGPSYGSFASGQARKLIPSAGPLLPSRHCDSRAEVARQSRRSFFPARFIRHRRRFAGKLSPPNPLRSRWRLCRLTDAACPPGGTPANNGGGKPPPYSAWQFPRQPGFSQTGDHRSPLRTARRVVAPHVVDTSYGSLASPQAAKLVPSTVPPLPTTTTPLGRRGAPLDGQMISAPTGRGDSRCLVRAK